MLVLREWFLVYIAISKKAAIDAVTTNIIVALITFLFSDIQVLSVFHLNVLYRIKPSLLIYNTSYSNPRVKPYRIVTFRS